MKIIYIDSCGICPYLLVESSGIHMENEEFERKKLTCTYKGLNKLINNIATLEDIGEIFTYTQGWCKLEDEDNYQIHMS